MPRRRPRQPCERQAQSRQAKGRAGPKGLRRGREEAQERGQGRQIPAADKALADAKSKKVPPTRRTSCRGKLAKTPPPPRKPCDTEKKAAEAKTAADKVRKERDETAKVFADAKKLYDEAQGPSEANKAKSDAVADAKKKEDVFTKAEKATSTSKPASWFSREVNWPAQDLAKAEAKEKEQGYKTSAEETDSAKPRKTRPPRMSPPRPTKPPFTP